ncbi:MAG TPA: sigma-70 family RNA polymerase sigma factor [Anaerolineales bacterium]|jgi:RNA polymerase sigma-70 factor (ECF subfamily)
MTETSAEISLDALRAGDRTEFARLVDAYSTPVYRLALRMLGDQQDAEDVLQTTFIKAFQHVTGFEGRSSLATWLYRIAANEALMLIRRRKPSISLDEGPEDDDGESLQPLQLADWTALPESELLTAETKHQLERAIESLPPKLRAVFLMRDIEGLSIRETSDALDLTETAVKTRLLRARLHLREKLSDYFAERQRQEKNDETRT